MFKCTHSGGDRQRPCNKQTDCSGADFIRPLSFADADIQLVAHHCHLHGDRQPHSGKGFPAVLRLACLHFKTSNRLPFWGYLVYLKLVFQMLRYTVGYGGRCPSDTGIGQSLARMYHCYGQFRSRFLFIYGDGKPA